MNNNGISFEEDCEIHSFGSCRCYLKTLPDYKSLKCVVVRTENNITAFTGKYPILFSYIILFLSLVFLFIGLYILLKKKK